MALEIDPEALLWLTDATTIARGCGTCRLIDSTVLSHPKTIEPVLSGRVGLAEAAVPLVATVCDLQGQGAVVTTCVLRNIRSYLHPEICTQNSIGAARQRYDSVAKLTEDVMTHGLEVVGLPRYCVMFLGMGRFDFIATVAHAEQVAKAASNMLIDLGVELTIMQSDVTSANDSIADTLAQDTLSSRFRVSKAADRMGFDGAQRAKLPLGWATWLSLPRINSEDENRDMSRDLARGRLDVSGCSRFLRQGNARVVQLQSRGVLLNTFFCQRIPEICRASATRTVPVVPLFSSTDDLIVVGPNEAVVRCLDKVRAEAKGILGVQTTSAVTPVEPRRPANTARRLAALMC
ncbi:MAG: hypothetical protein ABJL99_19250 [Aliishimia sp.]